MSTGEIINGGASRGEKPGGCDEYFRAIEELSREYEDGLGLAYAGAFGAYYGRVGLATDGPTEINMADVSGMVSSGFRVVDELFSGDSAYREALEQVLKDRAKEAIESMDGPMLQALDWKTAQLGLYVGGYGQIDANPKVWLSDVESAYLPKDMPEDDKDAKIKNLQHALVPALLNSARNVLRMEETRLGINDYSDIEVLIGLVPGDDLKQAMRVLLDAEQWELAKGMVEPVLYDPDDELVLRNIERARAVAKECQVLSGVDTDDEPKEQDVVKVSSGWAAKLMHAGLDNYVLERIHFGAGEGRVPRFGQDHVSAYLELATPLGEIMISEALANGAI
jgi:hypothetical protein